MYLAFQKCRARMEEEQISSFTEYNEKCSIHYLAEEWLGSYADFYGKIVISQNMKRLRNL